MKFGERILNWATGGEITKIKARYEAAFWSATRSYLPGFIQSAREDISALPRQEVMRRTRYFEKNSGVLLKVLRVLDVNVVGTGITPTPAASDTEWGKKALAWWNEWAQVADITEQSDAYAMQSIGLRAQNVDGDCFIELTSNSAGRPAIDIIEGHRIGTGSFDTAPFKDMGLSVVDGVVLDAKRRAVGYLVSDENGGNVRFVPARRMVKLFNRKRAGQYRGMSIMHAAILVLHDLDDLQKYEMKAAKDAASISRIISGTSGGATADGATIGASLTNQQTTDTAQRAAYYRQAIGGEVLIPMPGEEIKQFESNRPSAATSGFWDKLDRMIVQGAGISYAALVDYEGNWGGATLRACVQSDNRTYELETINQARAWQKVWDYVIGWAIENRELSANPDFCKVRWHPPRRATVDVGNDSKAMLSELQAGVRTYEEIYGESGEDWRERLEQKAVEAQFMDELADKYDIDRTRIATFAQESLTGISPDAGETPVAAQPKGGGKGKNDAPAE